jgi:hypothetical protein
MIFLNKARFNIYYKVQKPNLNNIYYKVQKPNLQKISQTYIIFVTKISQTYIIFITVSRSLTYYIIFVP